MSNTATSAHTNRQDWAAYERSLKLKNLADRTVTGYRWWFHDLAQWLDGGDVTTATRADLEEYFLDLGAALKATSVAIAYRTLRAYYNWCVKEEIIDRSPMIKINSPKIVDAPPDLATDDELRALLKACAGKTFDDRRDTAIIRLWCEPGTPRRAETTGLRLEHLDMSRNQIDLLGKGSKWRTLFFGNKTGQALDRYLRIRAKHPLAALPYLWLGQRGQQLTDSGLTQMLTRRCKQAGIRKLRPHQLRHTSYHHWREAGGDIDDAEELFGWSRNSRMGAVYARGQRRSRAERAARKITPADRL